MIVFDGFQLIGFALLVLFLLMVGLIRGTQLFVAWAKTGFCRHRFKFKRANSFGQHHWYECEKCGEERLK